MMNGRFYKCMNETDNIKVKPEIARFRNECTADRGLKWENSKVNFDNVFSAYLALLQVVSLYTHSRTNSHTHINLYTF